MLTNKNIVCPENLLNIAKGKGPVKAVIVNAVKKVAIESAKQAVEANLITPLFVGDKSIIEKISKEINWDISKYEIVHEPDENSTAPIAAKLASEGKVKIIVKGHIHTDVLMKAVLKRDLNLIGKKRLSHVWHHFCGFGCLFLTEPAFLVQDPFTFAVEGEASLRVGQKLAVFASIEVKTPNGRLTGPQQNWMHTVQTAGGIAGVARSPEDALQIISA